MLLFVVIAVVVCCKIYLNRKLKAFVTTKWIIQWYNLYSLNGSRRFSNGDSDGDDGSSSSSINSDKCEYKGKI